MQTDFSQGEEDFTNYNYDSLQLSTVLNFGKKSKFGETGTQMTDFTASCFDNQGIYTKRSEMLQTKSSFVNVHTQRAFQTLAKQQIVYHYGYIVGQIVREFFETVMDPIADQKPIKLSHFHILNKKLIHFFRKVSFAKEIGEAKQIVTHDIVDAVKAIRDNLVSGFIQDHRELWSKYHDDPRYFKGLLWKAD